MPLVSSGDKGANIASNVLRGERLSRNDLLDVGISDDDTFNGSYVVSRDGMLKLTFLLPIHAQRCSTDQAEADIANALIADGFYQEPSRISVRAADLASVSVGIFGAFLESHAV